MKPSDDGRFCDDCKKVVRDLSRMRERDAQTLLRSAHNGELCVRYLYDRHGKIFFSGDQAAPLVPASLLHRAKRAALAAAALAVPLSLQACSPSSGSMSETDRHATHDNQDDLHELMGGAPPMPDPQEIGDGGARGDGADDGGDGGPSKDSGSDAAGDAELPI